MKNTVLRQMKTGRIIQGRLPHGSDLLQALSDVCAESGIEHGEVSAVGALTRASVIYYNQNQKVYEPLEFEQHMEILSLMGNISLLDFKPFVHGHLVLGDSKGACFGGHLADGCLVFACEFIIRELIPSRALERGLDQTTGLKLWLE